MRIEIKDKKKFIKLFNDLFKQNQIKVINGISIDSKKIQKNDIYIPIVGQRFNGHDFIKEAFSNGAIKCFSEIESKDTIKIKSSINLINKLAFFWHDNSKHKVIGITGSNGKTTTKDLLYKIISENNSCYKSKGNFNSSIGLPLSYLSSLMNVEYCVIEYGASKPNEIKKLCKTIKPNISIITNISNAHIKNYNSIKEIYNTKKAIFECLNKDETAFINLDDKYINRNNYKCKTITYSLTKEADYMGSFTSNEKDNVLSINNKKLSIKNNLKHLIKIILPVYAICSELGIKHGIINKGINNFELPNGRGRIVKIKDIEIIDDSYNANPASVVLAIDRFNSIKSIGKKIFILGDMNEMGKESSYEHNKIGKYFNRTKINFVITYGEKTFNSFNSINNDKIKKSHFTDFNKLIKHLKKIINKNDIIYLKGSRTMKLENIYKKGLA